MNKEITLLKLKIAELELRLERLESAVNINRHEETHQYYSVSQYAQKMNLSTMTVYKHIHNGSIPAIKIGSGWRIPLK